MKIMVIGNGGRETAIQWKLLQNPNVKTVFTHTDLQDLQTKEEYLQFATEREIDLTIVGSEALLVEGIVDLFQEHGRPIFGPTKYAAALEGSKVYAKQFMIKHNIKTASFGSFNNREEAREFVKYTQYPIVIKADGLAAGKGVFIVHSMEEAENILYDLMEKKKYGEAGNQVVIEEYLEGVEASILSIYDGQKIVPFISAKDHKKIGEGESGLNTGGMGVIAPNPFVTEEVFKNFQRDILWPTEEALKKEKMQFSGIIFFGLMITRNGVYLLEYNMRMGDPETQAILPLMESDFLEVIEQSMQGTLEQIQWKDATSCCVVLASGGYPENFQTGYEIFGLDTVRENLFLAGVRKENETYFTNGGRVLSVVAIDTTLERARKKVYNEVEKIKFQKKYFRRDIGIYE